MIVLSFYYKHGVPFDADYYRTRHVPMVKAAIADMGATKCEVKQFLSAPDGSAPLYQYSFSVFFENQEALQSFFAHPKLPTFESDVPNYYEGAPDVFIEKLLEE